MKLVKDFVIDRRKWLRGSEVGFEGGLLLDPKTGKQCCVGIYLSACGISDKRLRGISVADFVSVKVPRWLGGNGKPTDVATALYARNDSDPVGNVEASETEREREIKFMFERAGVKVRFIGPKRK